MNFYLFSEETLFYVSDELLEKGKSEEQIDAYRELAKYNYFT